MPSLDKEIEEHFIHHNTMIKDFRRRNGLDQAVKNSKRVNELFERQEELCDGLIDQVYGLIRSIMTRQKVSVVYKNGWKKKGFTIKDNGNKPDITSYNRRDTRITKLRKVLHHSNQIIEEGINGHNTEKRVEDFKQLISSLEKIKEDGLSSNHHGKTQPAQFKETKVIDHEKYGAVKFDSQNPDTVDFKLKNSYSEYNQVPLQTTEGETFRLLHNYSDKIVEATEEVTQRFEEHIQQLEETHELIEELDSKYRVADQL